VDALVPVVGILAIVAPLAWQAWQYADQKRQELRDKRFVTYHDLIKRLVEPDQPTGTLKLDRQIAVVYELRNFPEYAEVTSRILDGLKASWGDLTSAKRLLLEIDLTLAALQTHALVKRQN
jgi:hypothetical protein